MNKLDKQFEGMMKEVRLDSPSPDFMAKVMSRIQAEAAVQHRPVLQAYQPVISRKAWTIIGIAFLALLIYITVSGPDTETESTPRLWSTLLGSVEKINATGMTSVWQKGMNIFGTIPPVALLILAASMALWTLDTYLTKLRHHSSKV